MKSLEATASETESLRAQLNATTALLKDARTELKIAVTKDAAIRVDAGYPSQSAPGAVAVEESWLRESNAVRRLGGRTIVPDHQYACKSCIFVDAVAVSQLGSGVCLWWLCLQ